MLATESFAGSDAESDDGEDSFLDDDESEEEAPVKKAKPAKKAAVSSKAKAPTSKAPAHQAIKEKLAKSQVQFQCKVDETKSAGPRAVTGTIGTGESLRDDDDPLSPYSYYDFLKKSNRRDAQGRKMTDPEYDPTTLKLPNKVTNKAGKEVTAAKVQWWKFKSENFDCCLLFKQGKFYEVFEMCPHSDNYHIWT